MAAKWLMAVLLHKPDQAAAMVNKLLADKGIAHAQRITVEENRNRADKTAHQARLLLR